MDQKSSHSFGYLAHLGCPVLWLGIMDTHWICHIYLLIHHVSYYRVSQIFLCVSTNSNTMGYYIDSISIFT